METNEEIEMQLWEYIDGTCHEAARQRISMLIASEAAWAEQYKELSAFQAELTGSLQLEQPSMRFSKNVMESVAAAHIAPATRKYINKSVIRGIAVFFILTITALIGYVWSSVNWGLSSSSIVNLPTVKLPVFDTSNLFTSATFNGFLAINAALSLILLDSYLRRKKKIKHI